MPSVVISLKFIILTAALIAWSYPHPSRTLILPQRRSQRHPTTPAVAVRSGAIRWPESCVSGLDQNGSRSAPKRVFTR